MDARPRKEHPGPAPRGRSWRLSWMEQALCILGRPAEASGNRSTPAALTDEVGQPDAVNERRQMRAWVEFREDSTSRDWRKPGSRAHGDRTLAQSSVQPIDQMQWPSNVQTRAPGGYVARTVESRSLPPGRWALASAEARRPTSPLSRAPARVPSSARSFPPARPTWEIEAAPSGFWMRRTAPASPPVPTPGGRET